MLRSSNAINTLLLLAVVMCALSVVTSQHKARKLYIELQQEKEQAQLMEVEWGQLQLEQSTWATPARVEKVAVQQLHMQLPKSGQVQFIRLRPPSPRPLAALSPPVNGRGGNRPISEEMGEKSDNGEKP